MTTTDQLAAIEARANDPFGTSTQGIGQVDADRDAILALVRDQQARLDRVGAVAADLGERGDRIEEKFERNGNGSITSTRNAGRGIGYREAARLIRAAITEERGEEPEERLAVTDADLHAQRRHPRYEYATTEGPRKSWDDVDTPPEGEGWERNTAAGRDGWDRFDYTEESYWRRLRSARTAAARGEV